MSTASALLTVSNLTLGIRRGGSTTAIVDDVSLTLEHGERFGIVGESGSGKTMTLRAVASLLPRGVEVLSGSICYGDIELVGLPERRRRSLMGPEIAMIFQEPMTALNPVVPVGRQIAEGPMRHLGLGRRAARDLAVEMMARTGIPDPRRRSQAYPHQLSGGLRQRVMIAMALSCKPKLLLCDEPTTALDVTVQHQVLSLLEDLCDEVGASLMFVTHDLAVINQTCREMAVMYSGRIVETGSVKSVLHEPRHPYTKGLVDSAPDFARPDRELVAIPGFPPNLSNRPPGCAFAPRCVYAVDACSAAVPAQRELPGGRTSACIRTGEIFGEEPL